MLDQLKRKLNNKRGVSILFAMFGFLIVTVVSVIILTAALTSMKAVSTDRKTEQKHLTLTSAAQFVRDEMLETSYTYVTSAVGDETTTNEECAGTFAVDMKPGIEKVSAEGASDYVSSGNITITVPELEDTVNASFTMSASEQYSVIFTFTIDGSGEEVYLRMSGQVSETTDSETISGTTTYKTTRTISWGSPIITGLGD